MRAAPPARERLFSSGGARALVRCFGRRIASRKAFRRRAWEREQAWEREYSGANRQAEA